MLTFGFRFFFENLMLLSCTSPRTFVEVGFHKASRRTGREFFFRKKLWRCQISLDNLESVGISLETIRTEEPILHKTSKRWNVPQHSTNFAAFKMPRCKVVPC